jgi:hypothetical protein
MFCKDLRDVCKPLATFLKFFIVSLGDTGWKKELHPYSEIITEATSQWDATGEAALLDDVSNYVYEIKCQNERRIFRLTHSSHRTEEQIIAELDLVENEQ